MKDNSYRVIIASGYRFIVEALSQHLLKSGHNLRGILTREEAREVIDWGQQNKVQTFVLPKPQGEVSIKRACLLNESYAARVAPIFRDAAAEVPDFIVAWGINVLPDEALRIPRFKFINIHPSDLPSYRGAFPLQAQILNGEKAMRVVIHETTPRIDQGPILARSDWIPISADETALSLVKKCLPFGGELLVAFLDSFSKNKLTPIEIDWSLPAPSGWGVRLQRVEHAAGESNGNVTFRNIGVLPALRLNWEESSVVSIARTVRAFDIMGGPYTNHRGNTFNLRSCEVIDSGSSQLPGTILSLPNREMAEVQAIDGVVRVQLNRNERFSPNSNMDLVLGTRFENSLPVSVYTGIRDSDSIVRRAEGIS